MHPFFFLLLAAAGCASAHDPQATAEQFYDRILHAEEGLGIPAGNDKWSLWPLMTPRLQKVLETAQLCQDDYYRQEREKNRNSTDKPDYWWLEDNLFAGGNEEAGPSAACVVGSEALGGERYQVTVQLTYRDSHDCWDYHHLLVLDCSSGVCLVDDSMEVDSESGEPGTPISELFGSTCDGPRWVGYQRPYNVQP